ncbi:mucin-2-like isoform X3 [Ahaetulla prasina]|uniref:mucin-2-like isoform X3 n=1 Tax=Ahaetulla prasina TaxID=499056 RepID=UPI002649CD1E|nr:mucin-2-like isoform X3 [Ahaetulla prasina]
MDMERKDPDILKYNILQVLVRYPNGVKFGDFIGAFYKTHSFHPQFSRYGYSSLRDLLGNMKETVVVDCSQSFEPVMKLIDGLNLDGLLEEIELNGPDIFEGEASRLKEKEGRPRREDKAAADLAEVLAAVTNLLLDYGSGLRFEKMQALLLSTIGIDLQTFSITKGYKDVLTFLGDHIPNLIIRRRGIRYVVQLAKASFNCSSSQTSHSPSFDSKKSACKSKNVNQDVSENKPASLSCSSYQSNDSLSSDSDQPICTSKSSNQLETEKRQKLVLSNVMASVTALLSRYMSGLRVQKLQELLLTEEGIDLDKFSFALGHKDSLEFLEQKMPQLILSYRANRLKSVVIEPHSDLPVPFLKSIEPADPLNSASAPSSCSSHHSGYTSSPDSCQSSSTTKHSNQHESEKEPDLGDISVPASAVSDLSANGSQDQNISASIAVVPPEVNSLFHTNQTGPSNMSSNLPSLHEPHDSSSVKAKSSSLPVVRSRQPNPCLLNAKSVTKQIAGNSRVTTFQPSIHQDELKQQVARILARHPNGLSLFQFRISYSATFKQHFPVGHAASTKQRLLEMPDVVYMKGHGVQALLMPVSSDVPPAKPGQPVSSKVENVAVVSAVKTHDSHSVRTSPLDSPEKPESKDGCISKDLSPSMLLAPCQEEAKSLPGFSDQLSKVEDIPVIGPMDESLIVPQSFLVPAAPGAAMMPIPKLYHSFIRALENMGDKPITEPHTQSIPGSIKIMQTSTSHLSGPGPELREIPFIPYCFATLSTHSQDTICNENLQPGILQSSSIPSTNSTISVPSVDSTPVPPVLVKPENYSPRSTSRRLGSIPPVLPKQPPPPILRIEQRNYNHATAEFDSFSEEQIQSRASQHFSSPDSFSLPRNSTSCFPSGTQLDHQLQQPAHGRLDDLQSISVSLADKSLGKASLDTVPPAAVYQRKPTYVNSLETSSTTESFIAFHASSVIANNSRDSSSVSSRTRGVSPASPIDLSTNSYDQIAYASAEITSNSSPLFSETQVSAQQREYARATATVISNTQTTGPISLSPESTTNSHHQFAYASSRVTNNSSALSSETYGFTHQSQNTQGSETRIASSTETAGAISPLDSTTGLPHQHAYVSAEATSTSSVLSKSTACHTPNADFKTNLNHDDPSQNTLTSSLSEQEDQSASLEKKQVPVKPLSKLSNHGCLIL